jgi:hypothetical protein
MKYTFILERPGETMTLSGTMDELSRDLEIYIHKAGWVVQSVDIKDTPDTPPPDWDVEKPRIIDALSVIPACIDRETWCWDIGMPIHWACPDHRGEGLQVLHVSLRIGRASKTDLTVRRLAACTVSLISMDGRG